VNNLVRQRRQAELDLVRLGAAVSTPLIETAPIGLAVLDRDLRYLYVNPALAAMNGVGALAHLGQRLDRVSPYLGPELAAELAAVVSSGRGVRDVEVGGLTAPGRETGTWLLSAEPLHDSDGEHVGLALSVVEITERKNAEAFREAFAGILSHELRTPITSIHAASKLLERGGLGDDQKAELVEDINQEAERLRRLVEDLVVLARVERGTIQIHIEPVLLPHVLRKVCSQEQARWPHTPIELKVVGKPAVAMAEATLVEQVLRNLIGNAVKYGPSGGKIEVIADTLNGCPRVRVLDRGPGVDSAEAGRLFELFYRSQRTAGTAGSGIGLFLVHRLIESMSGTIWARSRDEGPGAEFGFTLRPMTEEA
jgi:PAS domain S-box-containing protein